MWLVRLLLRLLAPLRAIGRWMLADWRNGAVFLLAFFALLHAAVIDPRLRDERDAADRRAEAEAAAHLDTIRNFAAAAEVAERVQQNNLDRVSREQAAISERTSDDLRQQLAALHARADRLRAAAGDDAGRVRRAAAETGTGLPGETGVPGVSAAAGGAAATPGADGFSELNLEERVTASEQAIQLDTLIGWVIAQHAVATTPVAAGPVEEPAR